MWSAMVAFCAVLASLASATLAPYVVADQTDNEGKTPGPVDEVCTYSGKLSMSQSLTITATLLMQHSESSEWATMPHPLNHSSTVLLNCSALLANVGTPGFCRYCKEYAVCIYARCLKGAEVNDICCNLIGDTDTLRKCNDITLPYNPSTRTLASCEFNYALYNFGSSGVSQYALTLAFVMSLAMLILN